MLRLVLRPLLLFVGVLPHTVVDHLLGRRMLGVPIV